MFEESVHPNGTRLFSARIIPFRGSWVEFTLDINDICYVHIDKKKKFPATALLRAFGWGTDADVYQLFYKVGTVDISAAGKNKRGGSDVIGKVIAEDVVEKSSGEIIAEESAEIDEDVLGRLERAKVKKVKIYRSDKPSASGESPIVKNTLRKDPTESEEEALYAIYSLLRPGEAPNAETARVALERVFFNPKRYDLGRVGRYKINQRLGLDTPKNETVLTREDFVAILRYLIDLNEGRGFTDDIDHFG